MEKDSDPGNIIAEKVTKKAARTEHLDIDSIMNNWKIDDTGYTQRLERSNGNGLFDG